jgi:cytochrome P450
MQDMFAAAIDTSYTTLEWAMAELMNHPDKMRRLQAEIRAVGRRQRHRGPPRQAVLPQVRDQGDAPASPPLLVPRETVDTELLGYHVPARTRVVINAWAIGRDPATWDHADEFVPERFAGDDVVDPYVLGGHDSRFVPFGAGRRG